MSSCNLKNERCGFKCTGFDGSAIWHEIHNIPKKIDCEECSSHAGMLFKGLHDHVNAGLGKHPFDGKNYKKFYEEVKCTFETCVKEGRCHG